jgi:hypothetical protein
MQHRPPYVQNTRRTKIVITSFVRCLALWRSMRCHERCQAFIKPNATTTYDSSGRQQWPSAVAVSRGRRQWPSAVAVSSGRQQCLSAVAVSSGRRQWPSAVAVSSGRPQWPSAVSRAMPLHNRQNPSQIIRNPTSSMNAMHETMNNQCFELTPFSRWYGQRRIVSLWRWNTYLMHIALI